MDADDHTSEHACKAAPPDPWEDHETAQLRDFLKLSYTERFRLLMHTLEFMRALDRARERTLCGRPPTGSDASDANIAE
jgi:hypothetical protein